MLIKKGQKLSIRLSGVRPILAVATKNFNTNRKKFGPLYVFKGMTGLCPAWDHGESLTLSKSKIESWKLLE